MNLFSRSAAFGIPRAVITARQHHPRPNFRGLKGGVTAMDRIRTKNSGGSKFLIKNQK